MHAEKTAHILCRYGLTAHWGRAGDRCHAPQSLRLSLFPCPPGSPPPRPQIPSCWLRVRGWTLRCAHSGTSSVYHPREGGRGGGEEGGKEDTPFPPSTLGGNVFALSCARRNKYLMGEAIRSAGLRAAKQLMTASWEEVPPFLETCRRPSPSPSAPSSLKVVLKPLSSAGSDGVVFASSKEEAREAFERILASTNVFGERNTAVLIQEYLQGTEFVVDSISHEGEHRVTAIWRYDKRPLNGAAFVYYGLRLWEGKDGREMDWALARYAHACLDALGVRNGFSHAEVMWLEGEAGGAGGPCLVEVGARPHGGEGTFVSLTAEAIGYNQLSVALDLIRDPQALAGIPLLPPPLKAHAAEVCLVSRKSGRLLRHFLTEHVAGNTLPSLKSVELHVAVGDYLKKTVDMLSSPGSAILAHGDARVLERDYECIHEMDLFLVEEGGGEGEEEGEGSLTTGAGGGEGGRRVNEVEDSWSLRGRNRGRLPLTMCACATRCGNSFSNFEFKL
ncbi:phosphoribosylglycinamide synthetase family protein [Nannochloropsis gaditana]|uniref:Phosphoribosylglycinamide synthetase family protein n=1 Tax=Nannochloropsis gaditana TaxID=72520 RepID=W7TMK4_9STRA|nr:phosphoribosylglycinamide synthetase family protein [Nannochloropsis gaditana]